MKNTTRIASLFAITLVILNSSFLILRAQTNYTWNGSTSTSFTTAANWTPNGVPGNGDNITIVSTGNNPVLAATDTVNKLTITGGTLDLGGHTLRVQHQLTVSGSNKTSLRATNGRILNRTNQGSTLANCKMDCILDLQPGSLTVNNVRSTDSVLVKLTATSSSYNNVYEDFVRIEKTSGQFFSGGTQPDTFLVNLELRTLPGGSESAYLAYSSNGNYVGGDLTIENLEPTANYVNMYVGSASDSTARMSVMGDVIVGANCGQYGTYMRLYGLKMLGGGTIRSSSTGIRRGVLIMERCHLLGTDTLQLAMYQASTANISNCTFYGPLRIDSATVNLTSVKLLAGTLGKPTGGSSFNATSCKFYGQTKITDGGLYISNYTYGPTLLTAKNYQLVTRFNHFTDSLYLINQRTTGNTIVLSYLGADTLSTVVATNTTSLAINIGSSPYTYFNGNLFLNATSTGGFTFGNNLRITGNVQLNTGAANVSFGSTTHTGGGLSIGTSGYTNSTLTFNGYKHSGSGAFDLTGIGGSTAVTFTNNCSVGGLLTATGLSGITLSGSVFNGGATVSAGSLSVVNSRFYGTTALSKTGSTGNYNYGNGFHGPTTITQSSSTAGLYWSNSNRDTSFAALTLNCSGSQPLTIANAYDFIVMGDLTVNRTGSGALTLAASNLIGKVRFEGGANQVFSSTGSAAALAYRVVVNKSAGSLSLSSELEVNNDVTLTAGLVKTTGSAVLKLRDNATATSASDASHVEGKVLKVGNDAFTFPVGRNGAYRPIAISAPSSSSAEFRAEYFIGTLDSINSYGLKDGALTQVHEGDYWSLERLASTNSVTVGLSWDTLTCCTIGDLSRMRVAGWNGSQWVNYGNSSTTGDSISGTIVGATATSVFAKFALAATQQFNCGCIDLYGQDLAGADKTVSAGSTVTIGNAPIWKTTYSWQPVGYISDVCAANPVALGKKDTIFTVTAKRFGCMAEEDTVTVALQYHECAGSTEDTTDNVSYRDVLICRPQIDYLPAPNDELKVIRVNVHIMQKEDGTGSFPENSEIIQAFEDVFSQDIISANPWYGTMNWKHAHNQPPLSVDADTLFGNDNFYVQDTRIRFRLKGVYFHRDSIGYTNNPDNDTIDFDPTVPNYVFDNFSTDRDSVINIFYVRNEDGTPRGRFKTNSVIMVGHFDGPEDIGVNLLFHEFGHTSSNHTGSQGVECPIYDFDQGDVSDTYHPDPQCWCDPGTIHFVEDTLNSVYGCADSSFISVNNVLGYSKGQDHFSPQQVGRYHAKLLERMRFLDCASQRTDLDTVINPGDSVVWDRGMIVTGDVIVKDSALLIIECTVGFPPGTKVVVERGGKLIIRGTQAKLTSSCGSVWEGIYVWGTPDEPQGNMELGGPQGIVNIVGKVIIEQAKVAIRGYKEGDCCNYSGGIIRAEFGVNPLIHKPTFLNCRKGVELMKYRYASRSKLSHCIFKCDKPMNDPAYTSADGDPMGVNSFVTLWDRRGDTIVACKFETTPTYTLNGVVDSLPYNLRGWGIGAIDTRTYVDSCTFTGLTYGIHTRKTLAYNVIQMHVRKCNFMNVLQGVLSEHSTNDLIWDSRFIVPNWDPETQTPGYGVYLYNKHHARVTGSYFDRAGTTANLSWGVVARGVWPKLHYSGGLISGNTFTRLYVATQTEDRNPQLQIRCNTYYDSSLLDWALNPESNNMDLGPQGSSCNNFSPLDYRAGNVFMDTTNDHIWSWALPFRYYSKGNDPIGGPFTRPTTNNLTQNTFIENCGLSSDASCSSEDPGDPSEMNEIREQMDLTINALNQELEEVIEGLDSMQTKTTTLLSHLANTGYSNSTLTNELVNWSLLSDTVLQAACYRTPFFTDAQFTAIVNHNSPVSWPVWQEVLVVLDKLDAEYADSIRAAQGTDSLRTPTVIGHELAQAGTVRFKAIMDQLDVFSDTDDVPDSAYAGVEYMLTLNDKEFYKMAIGTTLGLDTVAWSRELLDTLVLENREDSAFYHWQDLALTLRESGKSWHHLDAGQLAAVQAVAAGTTHMRGHAEAVLGLLGDSAMVRWPELLPEEPSGRRGQEEETAPIQQPGAVVQVYPNPSANEFNVNYELAQEANELRLEVYDATGRSVFLKVLHRTRSGTALIGLAPCNGLYVLRMVADGRTIDGRRLICAER